MNCTHPIVVNELFNHHSLVTRETAVQLITLALATCCDRIEIDFSDISFVSRSFADEFHKQKLSALEYDSKEIVVLNANDSLIQMFQAVAKTQSFIQRNTEHYEHLEFETSGSLRQFLFAI